MPRNPLIDCVGKAKRDGILNDAEIQFVLNRAKELGNEKAAVVEIHQQRVKEYEAIKEPKAADKTVIQTTNENVAMAAYMEEVRTATKQGGSPEKKVFEEARAAGEAAITGAPAAGPTTDADIESVRQFLVSSQQQGHVVRPTTGELEKAAFDLSRKIIVLNGIGNLKMQDTFGMYQGAHNRNVEWSFDAKPDVNLVSLVNEMAKEAGRTGQDSITVSRVLEPNEDSPNARPGIDITFKHAIPVERIDNIVQFLRARGIDGFTLIPSGYEVGTRNPRTFSGLRFQEIPEFSQQPRAQKHDVIVELSEELMKMEEVASVEHQLYDTLVLTKQDYDKTGILKRSVGTVRAAAWADRAYFASNPQAASERIQAGPATQTQAAVAERGAKQEVTTSKELETAAALVAAGKGASPVAILQFTNIYRRVIDLMQQNRAALEGMKFSAAGDEAVRSQAMLRALGELDAMLKFLPAEVRGKVGGYFQLAKVGIGEKALAKFFGDRVRTLERVLEQFLKQQYLGEINDMLNKQKARTAGGILKSARMTADAQMAVEAARRFAKMDMKAVGAETARLDAIIGSLDATAADRITAEQESAILALFGDAIHRSASELYTAYQWLQDVVKTGKNEWKENAKAIKELNDARAAEWISIIGGKATHPGLVKSEMAKAATQWVEQHLVSHYSFLQFLDYIAPGASFVEDWKAKARLSDNAKMDFHAAASDRLHKAIQGAIGSTSFRSFGDASIKLKAIHKDAVTFQGDTLPMSQLQAIQYILSWEQADVRTKMVAQGYTEETIAQMRALTSDPVSQAVYTFLRKEYAEMYDKVNPLYREIYGVDMPRILLYAPTRYQHADNTPEVASFGGSVNVSGSTAGFMHQRVSHSALMKQENALTVYWQHMNDVANFLNDAPLLREIRGVLSNPEVQNSIKQNYGLAIWEATKRWMSVMGHASNTKSQELSGVNDLFDQLVTNKAMVSLSLNLKSVLMQTDSSMRVLFERSTGEILRALVDPKFLETLPKAFFSDSIQRRIQTGANPAVRHIIEKSELRPDYFMQLARLGMMPLQYFDALATSVSAAFSYRAAYQEAKDMGMLDAAAEDYAANRMDESIYRFNQPVGMYNRSLLEQEGNGLKRMMMMFISDPRLKTAIVLESVNDLRRGKNIRQSLRRIVAVELQAMVAHTLANIFRDVFSAQDDDEIWTVSGYIRAAAAAPLAGLFITGAAIESALSWVIENNYLATGRDPLVESIERGVKAAKNIEDLWNADDPQDFLKELENLVRSVALIAPAAGQVIPGAGSVGSGAAALSALTNFFKPIAGAMKNAEEED